MDHAPRTQMLAVQGVAGNEGGHAGRQGGTIAQVPANEHVGTAKQSGFGMVRYDTGYPWEQASEARQRSNEFRGLLTAMHKVVRWNSGY